MTDNYGIIYEYSHHQSLLASFLGLLEDSLLGASEAAAWTGSLFYKPFMYFFLDASMQLQRKSMPMMMLACMPRMAQTYSSVRVSLLILMQSLMTSISPQTPMGQRRRKELQRRKPASGLVLNRQQRYLLISAIPHMITTVAKRSRSLSLVMKINDTIFLPKIWKKAPTMLPFDTPKRIRTISTTWKSWMPRRTNKSVLISDCMYESLSRKSCRPIPKTRYDHPTKLTTFTTLSIQQFNTTIIKDSHLHQSADCITGYIGMIY